MLPASADVEYQFVQDTLLTKTKPNPTESKYKIAVLRRQLRLNDFTSTIYITNVRVC